MLKTSIQFFLERAALALRQTAVFAEDHNLIGNVRADHLCYKCSNSVSFLALRSVLESQAEYFHQSYISQRRIAYIKLKNPIASALGEIFFIELSDQKLDGSQREGFDHLEFYPITWSYEDMVSYLETRTKVLAAPRAHHPTHDIILPSGFIMRCTREPLIEKIEREQINP